MRGSEIFAFIESIRLMTLSHSPEYKNKLDMQQTKQKKQEIKKMRRLLRTIRGPS